MVESSVAKLLSAIWGNRTGYVFIPYKDLNKKWNETPGIPISGSLPELQIPDKADVYFCPVVFDKPQRRKENALPTNLLWADLDPVHPDNCRIRPSIAWESSPGRYQALWFLTNEIPGEVAAGLSKRIAYADGADKGGWDLTQVLRLPGTRNYKYESTPEVKTLWAKRTAYSPDEIRAEYPPVNGDVEQATTDWPEVDKAEVDKVMKSLPKGLQLRITKKVEGADRSLELQKLARDLIRRHISRDTTAHLIQRSVYNKFAGRNDEHKQLLHQVDSAVASIKVKKEQQAPKEKSEPLQEMVVRGWNDFLSIPSKLEWQVEDSWINRSVGFISGRSKSYKTWIALDLALSVVSGRPFLNTFITGKTGPVLLIQEEDPTAVLQERLRLIGKHKHMLPTAEYFPSDKILHLDFPDYPLYTINLQGFNLQATEKVDQVRRLIAQLNPALVILDPLVVMLGSVDEYRASEVSTLLQKIKFWREEFGCSVAVVHHWNKGKSDEGERGGQNMYGSFAFHAWLESALHVTPIIGDADERIDTVTIEREFKAAPSGRSLKVRFEVDSVEKYLYEPHLEAGIETGHAVILLDLVLSNPGGMTSKDLMELTGFARSRVIEIMGALTRHGKIKREKGGGRGKSTMYFPPET